MPYIVDRSKVIPVNVNNKYPPKPLLYKMHDLSSVFTHYDKTKGYNVPTENKLNNGGVNKNYGAS